MGIKEDFHHDNEVITEMENCFVSRFAHFYKGGIKSLFHKLRSVSLGQYVEKEDSMIKFLASNTYIWNIMRVRTY